MLRQLFSPVIFAVFFACGGGEAVAPRPLTAVADARRGVAPSSAVQQMDCGDFHSCALLGGGDVRCWGRNSKGELGDGTTVDRASPVPVDGARGAVAIAAGTTFTCALMKDKAVRCWGTGRILGDGKLQERIPPTTVPGIVGADEIRAAGLLACARIGSGVRCWGLENDAARSATSRDIAELGAAAEIAVGSAHACVRRGDGSVRCWGDLPWAGPSASAIAQPVDLGAEQLVTGDDFLCASTKPNTVRCWGRNDGGQLGVAPHGDVQAAPLEVRGVSGAARVAAGEGQACAILKDGTVRCWGANEEGELGLGTRTTTELPQVALKGLADVRDVCIGSLHSCALTASGAVHCWGANPSGQVGDGTRERRLSPTAVSF